ncbi:hypothetical protein BGZ76_010101 [Entomortierella beljakovae]|nr:hypothetical protein BGZ76_010101 [Entomortierella beljakovae]
MNDSSRSQQERYSSPNSSISNNELTVEPTLPQPSTMTYLVSGIQNLSPNSSQKQHPSKPTIMTEFDIVDHPVKDTMLMVSSLLGLMVQKNDSQYNPSTDLITLFHSRAVPRISIESYLTRVLQFIPFTNEVLLNVLVYLDRIGGLGGMEMGPFGYVKDEGSDPKLKLVDVPPLQPIINHESSSSTSSTSTTPSSSLFSSSSSSSCSTECTIIPDNGVYTATPCSTTPTTPQQTPIPSTGSTASPVHHAPFPLKNSEDLKSSSKSSSPSSHKNTDHSPRTSQSSELPMIQKRAREDENFKSDSTEPNSYDIPQQSQNQPYSQTQREFGDEIDPYRISKKSRLEHYPTTSNIISAAAAKSPPKQQQQQQQQQEIDLKKMPGTPAATPKLPVTPNGFRINSFNVHRLLITCTMVAAKFTSDHFYSNARYAKVGGLSLLELNQLELEFLFTMRFELNVKVEELQKVGNALLRFKNYNSVSTPQKKQEQQQSNSARPDLPVAGHGNMINTGTVTNNGIPGLHQKNGRYSIPSPTSPRNGPMSDRSAPKLSSLPSTSTSASSSINTSVSTAITSFSNPSDSNLTTVVTTSEEQARRPQLLSPPEEKHKWAESEVQMPNNKADNSSGQNKTSSSATSLDR